MPSYMSNPEFRIAVTHSGTTTNYDNELFTDFKIPWSENGIAHATLTFADPNSEYYLDKIASGDLIVVNVKDRNSAGYTEIFDGKIYLAMPTLGESELVKIQADGNGWGIRNCLVKDDYGANSLNNPTLTTMATIIEDNSKGLIDYWVNTAPGASYTYTTQVEAITGTINYLLYPCKPAHKCLEDLMDLVTALKAGSAGPHWIVDTSDRVCVATIGNHAAPASTYWPTWIDGTTNYTLVQGEDFTRFNFEKLDVEANYILYHGLLRKPLFDAWTESSASWGVEGAATVTTCGANSSLLTVDAGKAQPNCTVASAAGFAAHDIVEIYDNNAFEVNAISSIAGNVLTMKTNLTYDFAVAAGGTVKRDHCKTGSYSIKGVCAGAGTAGGIYYPSTHDLNLNTTNIGGKYNIPALSFYIRRNNNVSATYPVDVFVEMGTGDPADDNYYYHSLIADLSTANVWKRITLPIGTYANNAKEGEFTWHSCGAPSWADIDYINFWFGVGAGVPGHLYIDDLRIDGFVLRGAKNSTNITANKFRQILITDNEGKDDSCNSTDATGLIAQCAYSELLRRQTMPLIGTFTTPMIASAMPGQLVHVHAKKKLDGTFNIDSSTAAIGNFRSYKVTFEMGNAGYYTTFDVTNDLTNSHARLRNEDIRLVMSQARPNFQDRQASSIKTVDLDITQSVLEKDYPS